MVPLALLLSLTLLSPVGEKLTWCPKKLYSSCSVTRSDRWVGEVKESFVESEGCLVG